jgi:hypothetical protein
MRSSVRSRWLGIGIAEAAFVLCVAGCGGATGYTSNTQAISVMVPATVSVSPNGTPVIVQIFVDSPSETAIVSFVGLPGGVQVKYSASDTSPSGDLIFTGNNIALPGSYKVIVMANSAGESASTSFTLVVTAASS